jgi:hypothetical protein
VGNAGGALFGLIVAKALVFVVSAFLFRFNVVFLDDSGVGTSGDGCDLSDFVFFDGDLRVSAFLDGGGGGNTGCGGKGGSVTKGKPAPMGGGGRGPAKVVPFCFCFFEGGGHSSGIGGRGGEALKPGGGNGGTFISIERAHSIIAEYGATREYGGTCEPCNLAIRFKHS